MSRPPRPQCLSPSPLLTRGRTTPTTRSTTRTGTSRRPWTEGNLEGTPGLQSKFQEGVYAGLIGGDCVATSRYKTQDVASAHHRLHASCKEAEGYATSAPLGDSVVVIVKSVNRVLLSLRTTLRSQLKLSEPTENRGRVVEAQLKIKS